MVYNQLFTVIYNAFDSVNIKRLEGISPYRHLLIAPVEGWLPSANLEDSFGPP